MSDVESIAKSRADVHLCWHQTRWYMQACLSSIVLKCLQLLVQLDVEGLVQLSCALDKSFGIQSIACTSEGQHAW